MCPDIVSEYFFGGMQYQLVHHLFPTLPRYRYAALVPLVAKFAKENGLAYKQAGIVPMYKKHVKTLRANAAMPPIATSRRP